MMIRWPEKTRKKLDAIPPWMRINWDTCLPELRPDAPEEIKKMYKEVQEETKIIRDS